MTLLIVSTVFTLITLFVLFGISIYKKKKNFLFFMPLSFLWFSLLLLGIFTKIDANQVGIIYHDRYGVLEDVKYEGFQSKSIFEHITKISTTNKTSEIQVFGQTRDSIYADFMITIVYRIEASNAGKFFRVTGETNINTEQLNSITKEALQASTINYDVYAILGDQLENLRTEFVQRLKTYMQQRYHITLISASFNDIDAGSQIEQSIQNKAKAIQEIEIADQERQKALVEAETARVRAEADAAVVLIKAEAQATAQIILNSVTVNAINQMYLGQFAAGEDTATPAVYGYLTIQEISSIILKQLYYDTWDGVLPTVITDGAGIIINP